MSILLLHVKPAQYALWVDIFPSPGTDSWICTELFSVRGFTGYGLVGIRARVRVSINKVRVRMGNL